MNMPLSPKSVQPRLDVSNTRVPVILHAKCTDKMKQALDEMRIAIVRRDTSDRSFKVVRVVVLKCFQTRVQKIAGNAACRLRIVDIEPDDA